MADIPTLFSFIDHHQFFHYIISVISNNFYSIVLLNYMKFRSDSIQL